MDHPDVSWAKLSAVLPMWQDNNPDKFLMGWLHYLPVDPWFVQVHVSGGVVRLDVPRDVLLKGVDELASCGELQVRPSGDPMWTLFTLRWGPDKVTFRVPAASLRSLLDETAKLVPVGQEGARINWDIELAALFEDVDEPQGGDGP
ncbi:SsgA family sporulation/cell division regulator [Nonomuraea rhizosphaerae]|uniref:SsgA family sporulation/cell division regulator n=1 Tax=Nonomuraea rhizosphaerae TaxID=2665663 RepID=UPI001C5D4669|nr:SsgA family sporulation/cell division regulator [Nonomuraea rhizosphaerae]